MPTFFGRRYMRDRIKKPTEVIVGIAVLLLTAGICLALVVHSQSGTDKPLFALDLAALGAAAAEQAPAPLPELQLAHWSGPRDVKTFTRDTLYEKIDGRADLYLQYNFRLLTFAKYLKDNDPDQDIQVWIYDMTAPENAMGVYKAEQPEQPDPVDIGREGYRSDSSIFFWKGAMYCSVITIEPALADTATTVAKALADLITDQAGTSWEKTAFPQENMVKDSLEYLAAGAFSLDFLDKVYTARYEVGTGEPPYTLFAHRAAAPADAEDLLAKYVAFFEKYGSVLTRKDGIIVGDSGGVIDAVFQYGPYLAGVSEAVEASRALKQAEAFLAHLRASGDAGR